MGNIANKIISGAEAGRESVFFSGTQAVKNQYAKTKKYLQDKLQFWESSINKKAVEIENRKFYIEQYERSLSIENDVSTKHYYQEQIKEQQKIVRELTDYIDYEKSQKDLVVAESRELEGYISKRLPQLEASEKVKTSPLFKFFQISQDILGNYTKQKR
ncbi:MAG: hypothetical protein OXQ96_00795 [Alphaproteobacteria bacterium]|nr:hypothetical protein [Alphaproteobacteria bacterium]